MTNLHGRSHLLDRILSEMVQFPTIKYLPVLLLVIGLWFSVDWRSERRRILFAGVLAGFLAFAVTRTMQSLLPERPRPGLSGKFDFHGLFDAPPDWSSFPSDTAGLALAIATAVFLTSRRLGVLALFWAIVVTCFPRLYCGYHYLSDLVAGGMIGAALTVLLAKSGWIEKLYLRLARMAEIRPQYFYPLAFFVMFQISEWFWDIRRMGGEAAKLLVS